MRCGTKLVSDGDTMYDVDARCGEPKFKRAAWNSAPSAAG